jgi:hypothetical protein
VGNNLNFRAQLLLAWLHLVLLTWFFPLQKPLMQFAPVRVQKSDKLL